MQSSAKCTASAKAANKKNASFIVCLNPLSNGCLFEQRLIALLAPQETNSKTRRKERKLETFKLARFNRRFDYRDDFSRGVHFASLLRLLLLAASFAVCFVVFFVCFVCVDKRIAKQTAKSNRKSSCKPTCVASRATRKASFESSFASAESEFECNLQSQDNRTRKSASLFFALPIRTTASVHNSDKSACNAECDSEDKQTTLTAISAML